MNCPLCRSRLSQPDYCDSCGWESEELLAAESPRGYDLELQTEDELDNAAMEEMHQEDLKRAEQLRREREVALADLDQLADDVMCDDYESARWDG